jgi:ribosomal-protein-alanine N-acetyltransferase
LALFRLGPANESVNFVRGDGVYLRPPEMRDYEAWTSLRERSRAFLTPWEPTWPGDDLTRAAFRRRLRRHAQEIERDESYPFMIFREADNSLVGGLTLGQIKRGVAQAATLGYWMGLPYAGNGLMSRSVRAVTGFAFTVLRLHRIEAACLPHNEASIKLLERIGFKREGFARAYLRINGVWQDHLLYALLETDPLPLRVPRRDDSPAGSYRSAIEDHER